LIDPDKLLFINWLKKDPCEIAQFQQEAKISFLVLLRKKKHNYKLLYDGRHFLFIKPHYHLKVWIFNEKGHLTKTLSSIQKTP
jgi:hypothetical protein